MVIVYVLAAWNDFSLSWGLSKTNFGVLKVASGCGRKKGFCVAWIVMVSHTVLYGNTKYSSYIDFKFYFGTFFLCILGQVGLWNNASSA